MKNFKKTISLILAVCMIASLAIPLPLPIPLTLLAAPALPVSRSRPPLTAASAATPQPPK